jgi:2-iminobutanoate/2-iminopropanoate deaminase
MTKKPIETSGAPKAIGPYSQAVRHGRMIFCSGQIGIDPLTSDMVPGGVEAETRQVLLNLAAVLASAGVTTDAVVKTTIYLADLNDFKRVNEIYSSFFTEPYPARATVGVKELPRGALVEIDAIAVG